VETLRRELGVAPSERTNALYHHILMEDTQELVDRKSRTTDGGRQTDADRRPAVGGREPASSGAEVRDTLLQLEHMLHLLGETQQLVQRNISHVAATLDDLRRRS
jgi:hypothetical protein